MNPIIRIFRSLRGVANADHAFENYYGELIRNTTDGVPSAAEARRDFNAVRASIERVATF